MTRSVAASVQLFWSHFLVSVTLLLCIKEIPLYFTILSLFYPTRSPSRAPFTWVGLSCGTQTYTNPILNFILTPLNKKKPTKNEFFLNHVLEMSRQLKLGNLLRKFLVTTILIKFFKAVLGC